MNSKDIRGQRIHQQSLSINQEGKVAGQSYFVKFILIILILALAILAGALSGTLAELISVGIVIPTTDSFNRNSLIIYSCVGLAVIVFGYITLNRGFKKSFQGAIIVVVIAALILLYLFNQITEISNYALVIIILSSLGLSVTILGFILACLCDFISYISFPKTYRFLVFVCSLVSIATSTIIAYLLYISGNINTKQFIDLKNQYLLPDYSLPLVIIAGLIFGISLVVFSYIETFSIERQKSHFPFLWTWAIVIGSWRGTSFYNLDLSDVNFTNAKLANTDLRARKLYRTRFESVTGLERARVDSRYLDLEIPKVQKLLSHECSEEKDFSRLNLRGAYLQGVDLRHMKFVDTDLTGADLTGADLRGALLVNARVINVDFSEANLTGICIQDWNINSQTCFTNVQCDYIYRKLDDKEKPTDRHPSDRNFNPREFESLYQEVGNIVELVFKEGVNWRAFAFTLQKLQLEDEGMGLELRGIEKRGDLWIVKVAHNENVLSAEVERTLYARHEEMQALLVTKEQQINQLLGIVSDQSAALKNYSQKPFGQNFLISGSTITNLAGEAIEYCEAAGQVRSIIASPNVGEIVTTTQSFLTQLSGQKVAATPETQVDLIQQVMLAEAEKDPIFKQFLRQQGQQILAIIPEGAIATALRGAIAQL